LKESRRIEVMERRGRRRMQIVNDIRERENAGNLRRTLEHVVWQIAMEEAKGLL
jgi:hypothetical protein